MANFNNIKKLFSELQMLKRVKHEGVRMTSVPFPDSIAEHSLLTAQIAYVLAYLEGADPEKTASMAIFHDIAEIRIGDIHKVGARYIDSKKVESKVEADQLTMLPQELAEKIAALTEEKRSRNTQEGIICQDADWLEVAIQAKIYFEAGYRGCWEWIINVENALKTDSAKQILNLVKNDVNFTASWWHGLMKVEKADEKN